MIEKTCEFNVEMSTSRGPKLLLFNHFYYNGCDIRYKAHKCSILISIKYFICDMTTFRCEINSHFKVFWTATKNAPLKQHAITNHTRSFDVILPVESHQQILHQNNILQPH